MAAGRITRSATSASITITADMTPKYTFGEKLPNPIIENPLASRTLVTIIGRPASATDTERTGLPAVAEQAVIAGETFIGRLCFADPCAGVADPNVALVIKA